jgi:hypothetical protein
VSHPTWSCRSGVTGWRAVRPSTTGPPEELFWGPGAADQTGRRVLAGWAFAGDSMVTALYASPDGRSWTGLDGFAGAGAQVSDLVASSAGRASIWLAAGTGSIDPEDCTGPPTAWTSADLATWTDRDLPMGDAIDGSVGALAAAGFGFVAVGRLVLEPDTGVADTSWVSADGIDWIPLAMPTERGVTGPSMVADGPAGVIGISFPPDEDDTLLPSIVWALR